jgi:anthranilate synthase component 1
VIRAKGKQVEVLKPDGAGFRVDERLTVDNPLDYVASALAALPAAVPPGLPRFFGGAVGFLGYDMVRHFERLPERAPDELGLPDMCFALTDTVVVFDNLRGTLKVVASVDVAGKDPGKAYDEACAKVEEICERLTAPAKALAPLDLNLGTEPSAAPTSRTSKADYLAGVDKIKEYIRAGDAFQVVYSQRFDVPRGQVDPFDVYRVLRVTNPSPYMFHLEFPEAVVTGASPEVWFAWTDARSRSGPWREPAAGAPRRPKTWRWASELLADPKERAEHVMLIDLGRNDVGRVSTPGTVRLDETMVIERYSHVMHLVSNVSGTWPKGLRPRTWSRPRSRPARSRARPRFAPWRSSKSWSPRAAGSTAGRSATSRTPATWIWPSPFAPWSRPATPSTSRPARASWPTASPRPSTRSA